MEKNVGNIDRIIRFVLAAIFAVLYFSGTVTGTLGIILLVLAVTFTVTAAMNFCPLYMPFKLSTKSK